MSRVDPSKGKRYDPQLQSIYPLFHSIAKQNPEAVAITAPGRHSLSYGQLLVQVEDVVAILNKFGIGRNDRVAIILPDGPEMAAAFLSVAAGATTAPLNPNYRESEFEFIFSDLNVKALIVQRDLHSPARSVAKTRGISIIELTPLLDAEAGMFSLTAESVLRAAMTGFAKFDDLALVLHTSGTTSRPKIVPLTHANICTSVWNHVHTLNLQSKDRSLSVMPLFHIHALISVTLASLISGGSIVCTPGFDSSKFFEWMETFHPTWYSASPAIHQAILKSAKSNDEIITRCPLRFIRSAAASLSQKVLAELELMFNAPVIESYGMTEAAAQITSNRLPPGKRISGSGGKAAGPEVAIMDETGNILPAGEIGEIVIRGESVIQGYENSPNANQDGFTDGWLRTGDQGLLDSEDYLFIKDRLKEIINRGGEKISPKEVDEVMLEHPAVDQVVTFGVPHHALGEDLVAAVVLKDNAVVTEQKLREHAFNGLIDFKVPNQIFIVDEIPRGATGKLKRNELARELASKLEADYVPPGNPVEIALTNIWKEVLHLEEIGIYDNFFRLGGHSLLATQIISRIHAVLQIDIPIRTFFETPTIEALAKKAEFKLNSPG